MRIKVGSRLIAIKTIHMTYNPKEIALKKGKVYVVNRFEDSYFVIDSEIGRDHYWGMEELDKYFKTINSLNKNINIL